jgi:hypothetical protein
MGYLELKMQGVFLPSTHGFRFVNSFPVKFLDQVTIPAPFGDYQLPLKNAAYGLCGGMSFAAMDYYQAGIAIPTLTEAPVYGDVLFGYLRRRQLDSLSFTAVWKFWHLMRKRHIETVFPFADNGSKPAPLGLVYAHSHNLLDLFKNHQVLAYDYTGDVARGEVLIYDPNYPGDNQVSLRFADGSITHTHDGAVRAVFRLPYKWKEPVT